MRDGAASPLVICDVHSAGFAIAGSALASAAVRRSLHLQEPARDTLVSHRCPPGHPSARRFAHRLQDAIPFGAVRVKGVSD